MTEQQPKRGILNTNIGYNGW